MIEQGKERIRRIREKINQLSKIDPSKYLSEDELQKIKSKFSIKFNNNIQHYPKLDEEIVKPNPPVQNTHKRKLKNVCNLDTQYFKELHIKLDVEVHEKLKQNIQNIKRWRLVGAKNMNKINEENKGSVDILIKSQEVEKEDQNFKSKPDEILSNQKVFNDESIQKKENEISQVVSNNYKEQTANEINIGHKVEQKQALTKETVDFFPNATLASSKGVPEQLLTNSPKQSEPKSNVRLFSNVNTPSLFKISTNQGENKPNIGLFSNKISGSLFPHPKKEQQQDLIKPPVELFSSAASPSLFSNPLNKKPLGGLFSTNSTPVSLFSNTAKQAEIKPSIGLFSNTAPGSLFSNPPKQTETKPVASGLFSTLDSASILTNPSKQQKAAEIRPSLGLFSTNNAPVSLFLNPHKQAQVKSSIGLFSNSAPVSQIQNSQKQTQNKPVGLFSTTASIFNNPPKENKEAETRPSIGLFSTSTNEESYFMNPVKGQKQVESKPPIVGLLSNKTQTSLFSNPIKQTEIKPSIGLFSNTTSSLLISNPPNQQRQSETKANIGLFSNSTPSSLFSNPPKSFEAKTPVVGLFSSTNGASIFPNSSQQTERKPIIGNYSITAPSSLFANTSSQLFSNPPKEEKQSEAKPASGIFSNIAPSLPKETKEGDNKLSAIGPGGTKLSLHSFNIKQTNKSQSLNPFKPNNPFMFSSQSPSFLNSSTTPSLPNPSNTLFSNSLFPIQSSSGGLFSNLEKSIFNKQSNAQVPDLQQDEGQQDDDGPIQAVDDANPQLSTVKYDYVQTIVHFKQVASKFREGTKETLQNVVVSIQQFQGSEDIFVLVRMQNKCITFNGKILNNLTQTRILNNNSKNVEVKKILLVKDSISAHRQLAIIRLQFKQPEIGSKFIKKFQGAGK